MFYIVIVILIIIRSIICQTCDACPEGSYQTICGNAYGCVICPPGHFCPEFTRNPTACPTKKYNENSGSFVSGDCGACPLGSYTTQMGSISCIECPAGYGCTGGAITPCESGYFTERQFEGSCDQCPAGYFCSDTASSPEPCPIGHFSAAGASFCEVCPDGYYTEEGAQTGCLDCPIGAKCSGGEITICPVGTTSTVRSSKCTLCDAGTYNILSGYSTCDNCPTGIACNVPLSTSPTVCPAGTYAALSDGVCSPCDDGTFTLFEGDSVCETCPAGSRCVIPYEKPIGCTLGTISSTEKTQCELCSAGNYCPDPAGAEIPCEKGFYSVGGIVFECTPCPLGTYQDSTGESQCLTCPTGKDCSDPTNPVTCTDGFYSNTQSGGNCEPCPPGSYTTVDLQTRCQSCPPGEYCASTNLAGTSCDDGSIAPGYNNTECTACLPGTYSNAARTECLLCDAGEECPNGIAHTACDDGFYSLGGSASCIVCPAGYFCADKVSSPESCPLGTISGIGQIVCDACPDGYVCTNTNSETVQCPVGTFPSDGGCVACPAGSECDATGTVTVCADGYYSFEGDGYCTYCPAGHNCSAKIAAVPCPESSYSTGGAVECTPCEAGKMCPMNNMPSIDCVDGTYSTEGQILCTPCHPGQYCDDKTLKLDTPQVCSDGEFAPLGSSTCTDCPAGFFCPDPYAGYSPVTCPPGHFNEAAGVNPTCQECQEGYYCKEPSAVEVVCDDGLWSYPGEAMCHNCPINYNCGTKDGPPVPCAQTNPKSYSLEKVMGCIVCPDGMVCPGADDDNYRPCPLGMFCENGDEDLCPYGYYGVQEGEILVGDACDPCPIGYFCPDGTSVIDEHLLCPRGQYCDADDPTINPIDCPVGTYNSELGAESIGDCKTCPEGFFCPIGSPTYEDNPCPQGMFCPPGQATGTICPEGTYNPEFGKKNASDCLACPAGQYCETPRVTPDDCLAGTYNPHTGASDSSFCRNCRAGKICPFDAMITDETYPCLAGYFCPEGTEGSLGLPYSVLPGGDQCPDGTYSYKTDLTREEDCEICYEGFACPQAGIVTCAVGHYCPGAPKDGSTKTYTIENYNGEYCQTDSDFPCPEGTYNPNTGAKHIDECWACPAGYYCTGGLATWDDVCDLGYYCPENSSVSNPYPCPPGTYSNQVIGSEEECTECPVGFYCVGGLTNYVACPEGTYSNRTRTEDAGPANYDVDPNACTYCPAGYFCKNNTIQPEACGVGYYSTEGSVNCTVCPQGHYCQDNDTTYDRMMYTYECEAGRYCDEGQEVEPDLFTNPCPKGFYCPDGADEPISCPVGTYNPAEGRTEIDDCFTCPAGYYCIINSTEPVLCEPGAYCPLGSYLEQQVLCPAATYRTLYGGKTSESCAICKNGYFCDEGTVNPEICPQGFYCIHGTEHPEPCPIGTYGASTGVIHEEFCTNCPPGKFCDGVGLVKPSGNCSSGHYCITRSHTAAPQELPEGGPCPEGGYCIEGAETPASCPPGTYNNYTAARSEDDCALCLPGYYCYGTNSPLPTGHCWGGFYCDIGSADPEQHSTPAGYYTLEGAPSPVPCAPGYYNTIEQMEFCDPCPPGYYCPIEATSSYLDCPIGHYCPGGNAQPEKCPFGTYTNEVNRRNVSQCDSCDAGKYCGEPGLSSPTGDCYAGHYCSSGSPIPDPISKGYGDLCTPGYYCLVGTDSPNLECPSGTFMPYEGAREVSECVPCSPGKYCDSSSGGLSAPSGDCDNGYYCRLGALTATPPDDVTGGECTVGHYCPTGSKNPIPCASGTYQPNTQQSSCLPCPKSNYCPGETSVEITCPEGHYCPEGTGFLQDKCPPGSFSNSLGLENITQCEKCSGGSFCSTDGLVEPNGVCSEGYFCEEGAKDSQGTVGVLGGNGGECTVGHYCEEGTELPVECPIGFYSNEVRNVNESDCQPCTPGYYCPTIATVTPTLLCGPGYYCSLGAKIQYPDDGITGDECPAGHKCPEGSWYPIPCDPGTYQSSTGQSECLICPASKYCLGRTVTPEPCEKGYYCGNSTGLLQVGVNGCPNGTYSDLGSLVDYTQCDLCDSGRVCEGNALVSPDADCLGGMYCQNGIKDYLGAISIIGGFSEDCPIGNYCPEQTPNYIGCPVGSFSSDTGNVNYTDCTSCTPGWFCDEEGLTGPIGECQTGYYCMIGSTSRNSTVTEEGGECWEGHYCPLGTVYPIGCPDGTYSNVTGSSTCLDCPEGFYCPLGTIDPIVCPMGEYCPLGSGLNYNVKKKCPMGSYNPDFGIWHIDNCTLCDIGKYCSQNGLVSPDGICSPGYFCTEGAVDSSGTLGVLGGDSELCPSGYYCLTGATSTSPCPISTYNPNTGALYEEHCLPCPKGYYCDELGLDAPKGECLEGYFCPESQSQKNSSEYICPKGHYCPQGSGDPIGCEDGLFQNQEGQSSCEDCNPGYYCHGNATEEADCPLGYYCEAKTDFPSVCPNGTYGVSIRAEHDGGIYCRDCNPGYYCQFGIERGFCAAGYICNTKNDVPDPVGDISFGDLCPIGYYCPSGSHDGNKIICPPGTINTEKGARRSFDCTPCSAGFYCPGSVVALQCPTGNYCPTKSDPIPCPLGTFNPYLQGENETDCINCDAGYVCDTTGKDTLDEDCPKGYFCPEATITPEPCPLGTYNDGFNAEEMNDCLVCPEGKYCLLAETIPRDCSNGYYCQAGSSEQEGCPPGFYCPGNSSTPINCPPGYYCPYQSQSPIKCTGPVYCPGNDSFPISCSFGWKYLPGGFLRIAQNQSCEICPPGTYMNNTVLNNTQCHTCATGHICLEGATSGEPTNEETQNGYICPLGHYCPSGSVEPLSCLRGRYQNEYGQGVCKLCPDDHFTENEGSESCRKCGPHSYGNSERTECVCFGGERIYQKTDGYCVCKPGYGYYEDYVLFPTDNNGMGDCEPITLDDCSTRDILGNCVDEEEVCGSGCVLLPHGVCECNDFYENINECNETCDKTRIRYRIRSGIVEIYDPLSDSVLHSYDISSFSAGLVDTNQNYDLSVVIMNDNGFGGYSNPTFEYLHELLNLTTFHSIRRSINVNTNDILTAPVVCLVPGEGLTWDLTSDGNHYPVYEKDSLMNTNDEFDYGAFRKLDEQMKSGVSDLTSFVFKFDSDGVYCFSDNGDETKMMIVKVSADCTETTTFSPQTSNTLSSFKLEPGEPRSLTPSWLMIGFLFISFCTCCLSLLCLTQYLCTRAFGGDDSLVLSSLSLPIFGSNSKSVSEKIRKIGDKDGEGKEIVNYSDFTSKLLFRELDKYFNTLLKEINTHRGLFNEKYEKVLMETEVIKEVLRSNQLGKQCKIVDTDQHVQKIKEIKNSENLNVVNEEGKTPVDELIDEYSNTMLDVIGAHEKSMQISNNLKKERQRGNIKDFFQRRNIVPLENKGIKLSGVIEKDYHQLLRELKNLKQRQTNGEDISSDELDDVLNKFMDPLQKKLESLNDNTLRLIKIQRESQKLDLPGKIGKYFRDKLESFIFELLKRNSLLDDLDEFTDNQTDVSDISDLDDLEDDENDSRIELFEKQLKREKIDQVRHDVEELEELEDELKNESNDEINHLNKVFDDSKEQHLEDLKNTEEERIKRLIDSKGGIENVKEEDLEEIRKNSEKERERYEKELENERITQNNKLDELLEQKKRRRIEALKKKHKKTRKRLSEKEDFERDQFEMLEGGLQDETITEDIEKVKELLQKKLQQRDNFIDNKKSSDIDDVKDLAKEEELINKEIEKQKIKTLTNGLVNMKKKSQKRYMSSLNPSISVDEKKNILDSFKNSMSDYRSKLNDEQSKNSKYLEDKLRELSSRRKQRLQTKLREDDQIEVNRKVEDLQNLKEVLNNNKRKKEGGVEGEDNDNIITEESLLNFNEEEENNKEKIRQRKEKQKVKDQKDALQFLETEIENSEEEIKHEEKIQLNHLEEKQEEEQRRMDKEIEKEKKLVMEVKKRELDEKLRSMIDPKQKDKLLLEHKVELQKYEDELHERKKMQLSDLEKRIEAKKRRIQEEQKKKLRKKQMELLKQQQNIIDSSQKEEEEDDDDEEEDRKKKKEEEDESDYSEDEIIESDDEEEDSEKEKSDVEDDDDDEKSEKLLMKKKKEEEEIEGEGEIYEDIQLGNEKIKELENLKKEQIQKLDKMETDLNSKHDEEVKDLEINSKKKLQELKNQLLQENKNRLATLKEKMKVEMELSNEEDKLKINENYKEEKEFLRKRINDNFNDQLKRFHDLKEKKMEKLKKQKEEQLSVEKEKMDKEREIIERNAKIEEEVKLVLNLLNEKNKKLDIKNAIHQIVNPRHKKELNELYYNNRKKLEEENPDEDDTLDEEEKEEMKEKLNFENQKKEISLRKIQFDDLTKLNELVTGKFKPAFEDEELRAFEELVLEEQKEMEFKTSEEKQKLQKELSKWKMEQEAKAKAELDEFFKDTNSKTNEQLDMEKARLQSLNELHKQDLASDTKKKLIEKNREEMMNFFNSLETEKIRQNDMLRKRIEKKEAEKRKKKEKMEHRLKNLSWKDYKQKLHLVTDELLERMGGERVLTPRSKQLRNERKTLEKEWERHVYYELKHIEKKMFNMNPEVPSSISNDNKDKNNNGNDERDNVKEILKKKNIYHLLTEQVQVVIPRHLTIKQRGVYNFYPIICDILNEVVVGNVIQMVNIVKEIPSKDRYLNNVYSNDYKFEEITSTLFVKQSKLNSVGEFVVLFVHALAHSEVHNFKDDTNPVFLKKFYQCLSVINANIFGHFEKESEMM